MRDFIKKFLCIFLSLIIFISPVMSKEKIKAVANIQHEFHLADIPKEVYFKVSNDVVVSEEITIPANSTVILETLQAQKERRWHRSGFIICKLKGYRAEASEEVIDLSEKNIYFAAKKYVPLDKKEASILTAEIIITQAASIVGSCFIFFAPVDIAYFFTKGAIQKEKHPNWFKAGVYNAYDNSIFWFWLKGRPIDLAQDETVKMKEIKEKKALKLKSKIDKKQSKQALKDEKKNIKAELKHQKQELREEKNPKLKEKREKKEQKLAQKAKNKAEKENRKKSKKRIKELEKSQLI